MKTGPITSSTVLLTIAAGILSATVVTICVETPAAAVPKAASGGHVCALADGVTWATADGGCKDLVTGLVWSTCGLGEACNAWSHELSLEIIEDATEGGYNDWRMPTADEMETVIAHGAAAQFTTLNPNLSVWSSDGNGPWRDATMFYTGVTDRFRAYGNGTSSLSVVGVRDGGTTPTAPAAPSALAASAASSSRIDLSWNDNSPNEDGFAIERLSDSIAWSEIDTVGANATSYADTGLAAETQYFYRVFAYNGGGDSAFTDTATTTTQPAGGGGDVVVDCVTYDTSGGPNGDKHLSITVSMVDGQGPLGGAAVSVAIYRNGSSYATRSGTTDGAGNVSFSFSNAPSGVYETDVTSVTPGDYDGSEPFNAFDKGSDPAPAAFCG